MADVLALTRARQVVKAERAENDRIAALDEISQTVDAMVDLLAELDYPGAEIVKVIPEGAVRTKVWKSDLVDIPLWLLDVDDSWGLGVKSRGFGLDKQIYSLYANDLDDTNKSRNLLFYVPADMASKSASWVGSVRDALNRLGYQPKMMY